MQETRQNIPNENIVDLLALTQIQSKTYGVIRTPLISATVIDGYEIRIS